MNDTPRVQSAEDEVFAAAAKRQASLSASLSRDDLRRISADAELQQQQDTAIKMRIALALEGIEDALREIDVSVTGMEGALGDIKAMLDRDRGP